MLKYVKHRLVEKLEKRVDKCEAELKNMRACMETMERLSKKENPEPWERRTIQEAKLRFDMANANYEYHRGWAIIINKILCHI